MIREFISFYRKNPSIVSDGNSVISYLAKFLDEDTGITDETAEKDIFRRFLNYLKEKHPEMHKKLFFENSSFTIPKEFWELLCLSGEPAVISYLFNNNIIDRKKVNSYGMNALHLTAIVGNTDGMQIAIKNGIDINSLTNDRFNALHFTALSGKPEPMQFVFTQGCQPTKSKQNLTFHHAAARSGSASAMNEALKLDPKFDPKETDKAGRNILHHAAVSGSKEAMKEALNEALKLDPNFDPKETDDDGFNILHLAARSGSKEAMEQAVEYGIDPEGNFVDFAKLSKNPEAIQYARELNPEEYQKMEEKLREEKEKQKNALGFEPYEGQWFIKLLRSLGYELSKSNEIGMCSGLAFMARQAALAGEQDKFDLRIQLLYSYIDKPYELERKIEDAKNSVKNHERLSDEQKQFLDIQPFFDGIFIYQSDELSSKLLNRNFNFTEYYKAQHAYLPLLTPVNLKQNNGRIENILNLELNIKDNESIKRFLDKLKDKCSDFPISVGLVKGEGDESHEINLSYDPRDQSWCLVDANNLPSSKFSFNEIDSLNKAINYCLSVFKDEDKPRLFSARMYVHNDDTKQNTIKQFSSEIKKEFDNFVLDINFYLNDHMVGSLSSNVLSNYLDHMKNNTAQNKLIELGKIYDILDQKLQDDSNQDYRSKFLVDRRTKINDHIRLLKSKLIEIVKENRNDPSLKNALQDDNVIRLIDHFRIKQKEFTDTRKQIQNLLPDLEYNPGLSGKKGLAKSGAGKEDAESSTDFKKYRESMEEIRQEDKNKDSNREYTPPPIS